jgi:hypothetical protein
MAAYTKYGCGGHGQRCLSAITNRKRRVDVGVCGDEHLTRWKSPFENKRRAALRCSTMKVDRDDYQSRSCTVYMFNTVLSVDDHCVSNARFRLGVWTFVQRARCESHESRAINDCRSGFQDSIARYNTPWRCFSSLGMTLEAPESEPPPRLSLHTGKLRVGTLVLTCRLPRVLSSRPDEVRTCS